MWSEVCPNILRLQSQGQLRQEVALVILGLDFFQVDEINQTNVRGLDGC